MGSERTFGFLSVRPSRETATLSKPLFPFDDRFRYRRQTILCNRNFHDRRSGYSPVSGTGQIATIPRTQNLFETYAPSPTVTRVLYIIETVKVTRTRHDIIIIIMNSKRTQRPVSPTSINFTERRTRTDACPHG